MRDDQLINLICKGKACCAFGVNLAKITSLCKYLSSAAIQQGRILCYPQRKSLGAPPSKICSSIWGLGLSWNIYHRLLSYFRTLRSVPQLLGEMRSKWAIPPFHEKSWRQHWADWNCYMYTPPFVWFSRYPSKHLKFLVLTWLIIIVYNCINNGRESVKRNTLIDQLIQQLITLE